MALIGLQIVGKEVLIPLKSCSVKAEVHGYVVGLNSTLKYDNNSDTPVEVLFRFPVDESYAVVGMEAVIAGRRIKAEIKKKEEAKQDYNNAIASGHTAAFAEQKSGDIFSVSLGNLPVQTEAEIHLKLVGELPIDAEGGVRFTLPAVLKPRYTPAGSTDPLAVASNAVQGQTPAVYHFNMTIKKGGVADITSPTHTISVDKSDGVITVSLSGGDAQPLKNDLVILVHQANSHLPKVMYELGDPTLSQRSYMGAPAIMLSFFPQFEVKRAACELIFLVDRSGSMSGSYIRSASETLVLFLKSIPPGCSFNIIGFGSRYASLFPKSVPYDQEHLDEAIRHAETLQADMGGTELLSPLQYIFRQDTQPGLSRQVFVLTDGSVSNTQLCIDEVSRNVTKCRVFTFGIGSGASTALVNGLAKVGHGTAEFIKEGERMQPKVIESLKRALQPSVTELEVDFNLSSGFEAFQAPSNIPTIFNGDKVVIYGILKSKAASDDPLQSGVQGTVSLKGQISGKPINHTVSFDVPAPPIKGEDQLESSTGFDMLIIHQLAAKSLLGDWAAGKGWSSTSLTHEREQESTNLSIESGVISEHTAFVAVDVEQNQPIEGAITLYDVTATMAKQVSSKGCMSGSLTYGSGGGGGGGGRGGGGRGGGRVINFCAKSKKKKACSGAIGTRHLKSAILPVGASPCNPYASDQTISFNDTFGSCSPPPGGALLSREGAFSELESNGKKAFIARSVPTMTGGETECNLTALISLQQATGYWLLGDLCDKFFLKKTEAKTKRPPNLSEDIWATIVGLVCLESRYAKQKDEWELVALKAEMWLSSQNLPQGLSIASLKEMAKTAI